MKEDKNKDSKDKGNQLKKFAILTAIAFQMGVTIFLFAYIGEKIDEYFQYEEQWFSILFVLLGVASSLYLVIKQLNRINKSN